MSPALVIVVEEANKLKSFGFGAIAFLILIGLMVVLVSIGGGREHS